MTEHNEEKNILERFLHPSRRGRLWQIFAGIIILIAIGGLIDAGEQYNKGVDWMAEKTGNTVQLPKTKEIPFNLGLDLQGGTHLIYKADVSDIPEERQESAVQGVRDVIEKRVNALGVSEPNIRVTQSGEGGYRIVAELAGIKDVEEAIRKIGETPLLEFKEEATPKTELTEEDKQEIEEYNTRAEEKAEEVLGKVISGGDFESLVAEYDEKRPGEDIRNKEPEWITERDRGEVVSAISGLEEGETTKDLIETSKGYVIAKYMGQRVRTDEAGEPEKEILASHLLLCYKGAQGCENDLSRDQAYERIKELAEEATPGNFSELVKNNSTEPGAGVTAGELGWIRKGEMVEPFEDTVFAQETGTISYVVETKFGYHLIHKQEERNIREYQIHEIYIDKMQESEVLQPDKQWENTQLSGKYLAGASVSFARAGSPQVALEFNSEGGDLFEEITRRNVDKKVGIFLDGELISAPTVNEAIAGGRAVIEGRFTVDEAKELAQRLNAGALPVPISLISQKTVGASLGQESINSSLEASIVGLILVALFMVIVYRLSGLLAVLSLGVYGILVLAIFKLFAITLTLGSLAGFVVSIGMAVDANVLIFERLKEELRRDKTLEQAVSQAFKRAWPSIRDGNISTLITSFILMQFTTSIVRGFAIILFVGILVSMFTAIVVTRNFVDLIPAQWLEKRRGLLIKS
jgi:protein-export membrane protein SecD